MLELEVVTPRRRLFKVMCDSVTLPGVLGEFQILDGHAPLLCGLKTGILSFAKKSVDHQDEFWVEEKPVAAFSLMVSGGYAEVADDRVLVLSEVATLPSEVRVDDEKQIIQDLENKIREISSAEGQEFRKVETELERAFVKLSLVNK